MELAFYLHLREEAEIVNPPGAEECDGSGKLKCTTWKLPREESGPQWGEPSKPFTLPAPHWCLAVHAVLFGCFSHPGRWLKRKPASGSRRQLTWNSASSSN
jgi:hypothetical protein